jgi:protein O-mannosyl-transferase
MLSRNEDAAPAVSRCHTGARTSSESPEGAASRPLLSTTLALVIVAATAWAFGWPTRHGEFISGDDYHFALEHVFVNHPSPRHAWDLLTIVHGDLYQPLPMLSFQVNYAMAGPDAAGRFPVSSLAFHLTNIALHMLNAALACLLALRLTRRRSIGLLVGLMFACHPFALEPVAWISGRMVLLATTFSLLMLLACMWRREDGRGAWAWLAGASWLLALASKVMPGVPVAAAACDHHLRGRLPRRCWAAYIVLLVIGLGATWAAAGSAGVSGLLDATRVESETSAPVRVLLAGRYYLENYVWPSRLSPWSPPPKDVGVFSGAAAVALIEGAAFIGAAWLAWRHNRTSFLGLCLFVILLAPFLAATTARRFLTADRYMYLPIFGLHLAVGAALMQVMDALRKRFARPAVAVVGVPIAAGLVVWMLIGWRSAPVWSDTVAQARRAVEVYPTDPDVWAELARAAVSAKKPDEALAVVGTARKSWPDNPRLALQAGEAYRLRGEMKEAEAELRAAAEKMPNHARAQYYYALTLNDLGKTEDARAIYRNMLGKQADFLPAVTALAQSYLATGQFDQATETFERALAINPYHRDSLFELAWLMVQRKDWERAGECLRRILDFAPYDQQALLNFGAVLSHQDKTEEAIRVFDRLLLLDPSSVAARFNRASLLAAIGRTKEAEGDYRAILKSQPDHHEAIVDLTALLQRQRLFPDIIDMWLMYQRASDAPSRPAREKEEVRAWLSWFYVLANRTAQARELLDAIPQTSAARGFADWAMAYDALRAGDAETFLRRLGPPMKPRAVSTRQREQSRSILAALDLSGPETRNSPIGMYALARALVFAGDAKAAEEVAEQLIRMPDAGRWAEAARELVVVLGDHSPEARATPASGPAEENSWPR